MRWHFNPRTGSPYWLERAKTLDFDPRSDVRTFAELKLFPNVVNELRNVRATIGADLITAVMACLKAVTQAWGPRGAAP